MIDPSVVPPYPIGYDCLCPACNDLRVWESFIDTYVKDGRWWGRDV